jgi:hypothetical protein
MLAHLLITVSSTFLSDKEQNANNPFIKLYRLYSTIPEGGKTRLWRRFNLKKDIRMRNKMLTTYNKILPTYVEFRNIFFQLGLIFSAFNVCDKTEALLISKTISR